MTQQVIKVELHNRRQEQKLQRLLQEGWTIKTTNNKAQGYDTKKTCCFGLLFLPLALLGRKPDITEYILEKEIKEPESDRKE